MSVDEKVSEEEKQKRDTLVQLLARTLDANKDWQELYGRIIVIGYTTGNSSVPLLLPLGGYKTIFRRHNEIRAAFNGDVLVYFSRDKNPSFCSINKLYEFVADQADIRKLTDMQNFD